MKNYLGRHFNFFDHHLVEPPIFDQLSSLVKKKKFSQNQMIYTLLDTEFNSEQLL